MSILLDVNKLSGVLASLRQIINVKKGLPMYELIEFSNLFLQEKFENEDVNIPADLLNVKAGYEEYDSNIIEINSKYEILVVGKNFLIS